MPLTATVMARLAQDGRFDMDAPIQRYLPDVPETRAVVTGRKLAAHLAGTGDFADDQFLAGPCPGAREAVRTLSGRLFTRPAGLGHTMSRQGYLLLSAALESATGRRFSDLLNETVAGPAGMSSTMSDDPRRFLPGRSLFYERADLGIWLARSRDLKVWTNVKDDPVIACGPEPYDATAVALNQVVKRDGYYYGFYHANAHRPWKDWTSNVARSRDLVHWEKYPGNPIVRGDSSSSLVVPVDGRLRLYTMHPEVRAFEPARGGEPGRPVSP